MPFYVGIGRNEIPGKPGRASDRLRWVCSQIRRELKGGKPVKLHLDAEVMKFFILKPEPIKWRIIAKDRTRKEALELESRRIAHLLKRGHVLANMQQNCRPLPTHKQVINYIMKKSKAKSK